MTARQDSRPTAELAEIDPTTHPILAMHCPSVPPNWQHTGGISARIIDRIEAQRDSRRPARGGGGDRKTERGGKSGELGRRRGVS